MNEKLDVLGDDKYYHLFQVPSFRQQHEPTCSASPFPSFADSGVYVIFLFPFKGCSAVLGSMTKISSTGSLGERSFLYFLKFAHWQL